MRLIGQFKVNEVGSIYIFDIDRCIFPKISKPHQTKLRKVEGSFDLNLMKDNLFYRFLLVGCGGGWWS